MMKCENGEVQKWPSSERRRKFDVWRDSVRGKEDRRGPAAKRRTVNAAKRDGAKCYDEKSGGEGQQQGGQTMSSGERRRTISSDEESSNGEAQSVRISHCKPIELTGAGASRAVLRHSRTWDLTNQS
ncbi:Hypothetical protein FKW44_013118 [Caligus rogercresseyi]|uniref:Uncharacterized protein n=1 Tax=Caligus rogercresseyi TaxID=217165 RepID=A0A7T8KA26_CALRO|nr:Hypothetical protein FKW44_013118 [Caligus rogercresseyi]